MRKGRQMSESTKSMSKVEPQFLVYAEEYIARHEPDKSVEQIMVEFTQLLKWHKRFNKYLKKTKQNHLLMPKKSEDVLERRRVFINWYVEQNKGRFIVDLVEELSLLTFSSKTTITNTLYNYQ